MKRIFICPATVMVPHMPLIWSLNENATDSLELHLNLNSAFYMGERFKLTEKKKRMSFFLLNGVSTPTKLFFSAFKKKYSPVDF